MGLKRFLLIAVLALAGAVVLVPGASAGNFDETAMGCTGEDPATCAAGTTGQPYSLQVRLQGDEDTGCAVLSVASGSLPPGVSITQQFNETKYAVISGTPTQAGSFDFYLNVNYFAQGCSKSDSQDRFVIPINPGLPKLTIGPESTTPGTTGAPYSLQMTSNVEGGKTWTINSGALPPGLTLDASTGLISGTPTTAGSYTFEVLAKMVGDTRSDTKVLGIVVRDQLALQSSKPLATSPAPTLWEVSVPFSAKLSATGGSGTYTYTLAGGTLPTGLALAADGTVSGTPQAAGIFRATIRLADTEGRTLDYAANFGVANKLAISTILLKPGRVGKLYRAKLATTGGIAPKTWKVATGPLPKGIKLDRTLGVLSGVPRKPGSYRVTFEAKDGLKVTAKKTLRIIVAP